MRSHALLWLCAALAVPGALAAQRRSSVDSSFQWHGAIASGKTLRIRGIVGDIIARPGRGAEAVVRVSKRVRHGADPSDVEIHVEKRDDGVTVCAVYPNQDAAPDECPRGDRHRSRDRYDDGDVEVTFRVDVPAGVDFVAQTVTGDVQADSMPANVEGRSVTGDVTIGARGHGSASTVTGNVYARVGSLDAREGGEFKTVTGDVEVSLPPNVNADVNAATVSGDVTTDFPLTIQGRFASRRMHGRIGAGGPTLDLSTVTGEIKLRKR